jgi:Fic family protein
MENHSKTKKVYAPPYNVTDTIIHLIAEINEKIGAITLMNKSGISPFLRRQNQIRSIHSSLAIENNSLSLEQVTDVINGKRVLGMPKEILEVKNAFEAYKHLSEFDPFNVKDLLKAHSLMMDGLTKGAGNLRSGGVGIFAGKQLIHMAPPVKMVPSLLADLFTWAKTSKAHPLIKSCVFHYEFEFIHPFSDGNGRIGRMWQTLILSRWKQLFIWLPVETLIRERQQDYYRVLAMADQAGNSTIFIEFILIAISDTLSELLQTEQQEMQATGQVAEQVTEQVKRLVKALGKETFSAKEVMSKLGLKHRQSFRNLYLNPALKLGLIEMTVPGKPNSSKQKYRCCRH